MAIRSDASGDNLTRTTGLPAINAFTMMGWFKLVVDRGTWGCFLSFGDTAGAKYIASVVASDGHTLALYSGDVAPLSSTVISVGVWYHIAITCAGGGTNTLTSYVNGVLDQQINGSLSPTAGTMRLLVDNDLEWLNGTVAAVKVYGAVLTPAEVQIEMCTIRPQRFANLNGFYPCFPGSGERAKDYSGNGNDWTEAGTLTDEDGPPASWGASSIWLGGAPRAWLGDQASTILHAANVNRDLNGLPEPMPRIAGALYTR